MPGKPGGSQADGAEGMWGLRHTHMVDQVQGKRGNPIRPAKPSTETQEAPGSRAIDQGGTRQQAGAHTSLF